MVNRHMCFRRLGHFLAGVLGVFYFGVDKNKSLSQNMVELHGFAPDFIGSNCRSEYTEQSVLRPQSE